MITYLLQLTLCWGLFYAAYYFFLREETHFKCNRGYLLAALALGLIIPLVDWGSYLVHEAESLGHLYITPLSTQIAEWDITVQATPQVNNEAVQISWPVILFIIYLSGCLIAVTRLIRGWLKIRKIRRQSEVYSREGYSLVLTNQPDMPFSFLGSIYCFREFYRNSPEVDQVLAHEKHHINALHSLDVIFMEILKVVFWYHPMVYIYKNELQQIHEYQADHAAYHLSTKKQYGQLLLKHADYGMPVALANHFFNSQLKNRFKMMTKKPSTRKTMLKYLVVLPIVAMAIMMFSYSSQGTSLPVTNEVDQDTLLPPPPPPPAPVPSVGNEVFINHKQYEIEATDLLYVNGEKIGPVTNELLHQYSTQGPWVLEFYKGEDARRKFGKDVTTGVYSIRNYTNKSTLWVGQIFTMQSGQIMAVEPTDVLLVNGENKGFATQENLDKYVGSRRWNFRIYKGQKAVEKYGITKGTGVLDVELMKPSLKRQIVDKELKEDARKNGEIFRVVEQMPHFPGCEELSGNYQQEKACADRKMLEFLYSNIQYPSVARTDHIEGTTVISFVVEKDGSITNPKAIRDPGAGLGEEAIRVVNMMGDLPEKWKPGVQNGEKVRVQFILPVKFELNNKDAIQKPGISAAVPPPPPPPQQVKGQEEVFRVVEQMPRFPGCENIDGDAQKKKSCADRKMLEFLYSNVKYPAEARKNNVEGNAIISFIVEKDGSITDPKAVRDPGAGLGEEAIRVVQLMGDLPEKWTPGVQRGHTVRVQFILPIRFELEPNEDNQDAKDELTKPLLVIDDEIVGKVDIVNLRKSIDMKDVESINILKGESAINKYGAKGKEGVIEISSKWHKEAEAAVLVLADVKIYPVPAVNQLKVEASVKANGSYRLEVRDLKGSVVVERIVNVSANNLQTSLDLKGLVSGPYYLVVSHHGKVFSKTFVKQ